MSQEKCVNCDNTFKLKNKSYARTAISSKFRCSRNVTSTPKSVLEEHLDIAITPDAKRFICSDCEKGLHNVFVEKEGARSDFVAKRKSTSYIAKKLPSPSTTHSPSTTPVKKRVKTDNPIDQPVTLPKGEKGDAIKKILQNNTRSGLYDLIKCNKTFTNAFYSIVSAEVRKEAVELSKGSVFNSFQSISDIEDFSWETVFVTLKNMPSSG